MSVRHVWVVVVAVLLIAAGCGSSDDEVDAEVSFGDSETDDAGAESGDDDTTDGGDDDASDGESDGGDEQEGTIGDTEDAPEITGNDDLDLEELEEIAPDAAEALDEIDDIVSIGDCESETVGLAMTYVPDGHECRVLDQAIAGLDGFTLFQPGAAGSMEITIGTPSPIPVGCELLQACDTEMPLDVGDDFTMFVAEIAGIPIVYGTHNTVDAEVTVTTFSALTDDDIALLDMVLDGVVEI